MAVVKLTRLGERREKIASTKGFETVQLELFCVARQRDGRVTGGAHLKKGCISAVNTNIIW